MANLNDFVLAQPRPLPLFVLADVSGSMDGAKIQSLNAALREMVASLRNLDDVRGRVEIAVITFGGTVSVCQELTPAEGVALPELRAGGQTPMGAAFELLVRMIEDKSIVPPRAYTPTIVLISDGQPTDLSPELINKVQDGTAVAEDYLSWEPLRALLSSERASRCIRVAMGIGDDADYHMLKAFVNNPEIPVVRAHDARAIQRFFRWVTWSVSARSVSRNPNLPIIPSLEEFDIDKVVI